MEFQIKNGSPEHYTTDCLVIGVFDDLKLSQAAKQVDQLTDGKLENRLKKSAFKGEIGQSLLLYELSSPKAERLLLVGCGAAKKFTSKNFAELITHTASKLAAEPINDAVMAPFSSCNDELTEISQLSMAARLFEESTYRFQPQPSAKTPMPKAPSLSRITFCVDATEVTAAHQAAVALGQAMGEGSSLARQLGDLPANICTPTYLAEQAQQLQKSDVPLHVTVHDEAKMRELGCGAFLSVAQGSREPLTFIELNYSGGDASAAPIVLVGKGVTFDSGGISLKPSATMDEMKYDMCGAASVLGVFHALTRLQPALNVIGLIPACENLPDGLATKPGDIVTSLSGQTIEVLNTDAEGRMLLCDALTYAERFEPAAVIDIATLTGACVVALGAVAHGLLSSDPELEKALLTAGQTAHDRAWALPLWEEYQSALKSNFADMANVGGKGAGTITAACFLSRFTQAYPWAHLDIAGTAWKSGDKKGATGRPVPLLVNYLMQTLQVRDL